MVTKFQYKILKKALNNCGYNPKTQRQVEACKYLLEKRCLQRSRDGKHEYQITQEAKQKEIRKQIRGGNEE